MLIIFVLPSLAPVCTSVGTQAVAVEHEKLRGGGGQLQVQQVGLSW